MSTATLPARMSLDRAIAATGGLGHPSKMPGTSWGIEALAHCSVGTALAAVQGSTCSGCYATGANYQYPSVKLAHARRLAAFHATPRLEWVECMAHLISAAAKKSGVFYHRWLDSGDLRAPGEDVACGVSMLHAFAAVARRTPAVRHWVPTRELEVVRAAGSLDAPNIVVRLSPPMLDTRLRTEKPSSMVTFRAPAPAGVYQCPAPTQGNACGDCRACWQPSVACVAYHKH